MWGFFGKGNALIWAQGLTIWEMALIWVRVFFARILVVFVFVLGIASPLAPNQNSIGSDHISPHKFSFFISVAQAGEIIPQITRQSELDILFDAYMADTVLADTDGRDNKALKKNSKNKRNIPHSGMLTGMPIAELFTGVDVTENQFGFYAGGVTGALGPHLNLSGLRLRAVYGHSYYSYQSSRKIGNAYIDVTFKGQSDFYEAMAGYEFRLGQVILKAYGGLIAETNHIDPFDKQNSLEGTTYGAKLLLEGWYKFENGHWLSSYGAYSTGNDYYVVHGRYGLPLNTKLDFGVELGAFGNKEFDALRFGGFSRYKTGAGELTFSAGISGDYDQPDAFYGTMQYFTKVHSFDDLLPAFLK